MEIGKLLREARKRRGFTAEQVAEALDFATPTITRWENGSIDISSSTLVRYCEVIGITLAELFGNDQARLPILGTIRAGVPILAQEAYDGYLDVPDSIRADFALRVIGDSMIGVGILEGDLAICQENEMPQTGRIIVALQDDGAVSNATLKYYFNNSDEPRLRAANPSYLDLDYKQGYRCAGHMVALIRQDAPGWHTYTDYLTVAGHDEWTGVIELANGAGLKISQVKQILEGQIEIAKRLKG